MITLIDEEQENTSFHSITTKGHYVYPRKIDCHFLWDIPESDMCDPDCDCENKDWKGDNDHIFA